jgi:hypothetical protein
MTAAINRAFEAARRTISGMMLKRVVMLGAHSSKRRFRPYAGT